MVSGNIYVSDGSDNHIRKITTAGVVTTLAGNGVAGYTDGSYTSAEFACPLGLSIGPSGNIYLADTNNNRVRIIQP